MRINIAQPCEEDWSSMQPVPGGRHCTSCQKVVVDFSTLPDVEIQAWFANRATEDVCGRALPSQLGRNLHGPRSFHLRRIRNYASVLISAFTLGFSGLGQALAQSRTHKVAHHRRTAPTAHKAAPLVPVDVFVPAFPTFDWDDYVKADLRYPQEAIRNEIWGRVYVQFTVAEDGSICSAEISKGIGHGCDQEVLRLVQRMPAWLPARRGDKPVADKVSMVIEFEQSDYHPPLVHSFNGRITVERKQSTLDSLRRWFRFRR